MQFFIFGIYLVIWLAAAGAVDAVTVGVSPLPASISYDGELRVGVLLECTNCGDSYFRGVFYQSGTNYFGLTQNNNQQWIGSSEVRTQYLKVSNEELHEGSWSGQLRVKSDSSGAGFTGTGQYRFKVGRYTAANSSSATWSDDQPILIIGPPPTPTVSPKPTPAPSPTPSPTRTTTNTAAPAQSLGVSPAAVPVTLTPVPSRRSTQHLVENTADDSASSTPTHPNIRLTGIDGGNVLSASDNADGQASAFEGGHKRVYAGVLIAGIGGAILSLVLTWQKTNQRHMEKDRH